MAEVLLVFPPVVEVNFGSCYPSTAVLSAFLKQNGMSTAQRDLNEEFAEYLSTDEGLDLTLSAGARQLADTAVFAGAVRWVGNNRHRLFGSDGIHLFGPGSDLNVLELLASVWICDPSAERLLEARHGDPQIASLGRFFDWCGIDGALDDQVRVVGISVPMGPQLIPALALARRIKARRSLIRVVLGGPTLSLMAPSDLASLLMMYPEVDAVVQSDGEFPLAALCQQALAGDWRPETVAGCTSYVDGQVICQPPGAGPRLDDLPVPDYDDVIIRRLGRPVLGATEARGCYWARCEFCDHVNVFQGSRPFRPQRPERFVRDIEALVDQTGVRSFRVITEALPPAFARRALELIVQKGLNIKWNSFVMVDPHFDRDLLALMARSGCEYVVVGVESLNSRVLARMSKPANREQTLQFLEDARGAGLRVVANLIPDLPTTTYDEALQSLRDMRDLADCVYRVQVFPFETTRSSNIGRDPGRFGLRVKEGQASRRGAAEFELNRLEVEDPAMTPEEHADVFRRYTEFAESLVLRDRGDFDQPRLALRVLNEDIDVFEQGEQMFYTQVISRRALRMSKTTAASLGSVLSGRPFTSAELRQRLGGRNADLFLERLRRTGMIARSAAAAASPEEEHRF